MTVRRKMGLLTLLSLLFIVLFITISMNSSNWQYLLYRRVPKIIAMVLTGLSIAFSSMVFQTITNNRILTPNILGLDALYLLIQTAIVLVLGNQSIAITNNNINFLLSAAIMILFSMVLFSALFKKNKNHNIFFLLLAGIIFGTMFDSISAFMQMIIDPNEFMIIQGKMFASFNSMNTDILWLAIIGILLAMVYVFKYIHVLDVMSLGREQAINLGVPYDLVTRKMLIVVAVLVSISTALVGPITFFGLLIVNLTRQFIGTYRHRYLITGSILLSIIALVGGQLIIERVLNFSTTLSVIINLFGGLYFIYLLLKEQRL